MNKLKNIIAICILLLSAKGLFAQSTEAGSENASILHQNGQIYLVVLVLVTIFAGIIFYLIRLEKKINRLEKRNEK